MVDDLEAEGGEKFLEENIGVMAISLTKLGCVMSDLLKVSKFFFQSLESKPAFILRSVMVSSSGLGNSANYT